MPKFRTFEERMKHPQGKLIPSSMWNDNELFGESLDDTVLSLMKASGSDLISLVERSANKLNDPWLKKQAWLAIALSHPDTDFGALQHIAQTLKIDDYGLFSLVIILGKTGLFDELVKQYPEPIIAEFITQNVFYVYIKAAENGHQELLKKMETKISDQTTEMLKVANFAPYTRAVKNGHIAVLNHFEQTRPDLVSAMIKASYKHLVLHDYPIALEHMKEVAGPLLVELMDAERSVLSLQTSNNFFLKAPAIPTEGSHTASKLIAGNTTLS
jgi:hypothetical protein